MIVSGKIEIIMESKLLENSVVDVYDILTKDEYFVVTNIPEKKPHQYYGIRKHNGMVKIYKLNEEQGDIITEKYKLSAFDKGEITENILYIVRAMTIQKNFKENRYSIYGKIYTWDYENV